MARDTLPMSSFKWPLVEFELSVITSAAGTDMITDLLQIETYCTEYASAHDNIGVSYGPQHSKIIRFTTLLRLLNPSLVRSSVLSFLEKSPSSLHPPCAHPRSEHGQPGWLGRLWLVLS